MTQGERLKELRKNVLGLTLENFGEKLGVAKNTISQWESGRNSISESMLKAICREYNVNYFWLKDGEGESLVGLPETTIDELALEFDLDDFEKAMIIEFLKLKKEERDVVKNYIRNVLKKEPD